ncbi:MAG: saccharopine dehydrogenase family protein [Candidatus Saccharicenans sp.]
MKIAILGAGLVGQAMALDLALDKDFEVYAADLNPARLKPLAGRGLFTVEQDLSLKDKLIDFISDKDLVINATPGFMGYETLKTCLEAGKSVVDIAFFPEDPFRLTELALAEGVSAVIDCGVAPGLSHMLSTFGLQQLDRGESLTIYVGGLPVVRQWPFEYRAVFSPADVIEEYVRPARLKENGRLVCKPALSEPELVDIEGLGTLEAFNTDGLRTLLRTLDLPDMKEKTLRYPGHREKMLMLREAGFFSSEPVELNGQKIKPVEFTNKILFSRLILSPGEEDLTVMKVLVSGEKDGRKTRLVYELLDRFDRKSGIHSMARTTGYTATMVARAFARGLIKDGGIIPPERLGQKPEVFNFIRAGLEERGIIIKEKTENLE